jgi:hypothetical protein
MPKYKMIALTRPIEGKEAEYNEWYQNVHLREVVSFPGFTGARRYKHVQQMGGEAYPYAAIYDIETDDLGAVLGAFGQAAATGKMSRSEAMDYPAAAMAIFEEFGPEVRHEDVAGK